MAPTKPSGLNETQLVLNFTKGGGVDSVTVDPFVRSSSEDLFENLPSLSYLRSQIFINLPFDLDTRVYEFLDHAIRVHRDSRIPQSLMHGEKTLAWLLRIDPSCFCDIPLLIAAFVHDMDRCQDEDRVVRGDMIDRVYRLMHSAASSVFVARRMGEFEIDDDLIEDTCCYITNHEFGGQGADSLCMADKLAFLDYNLPFYYSQGLSGADKDLESKLRSTIETFEGSGRRIFLDYAIQFSWSPAIYPEGLLTLEQWNTLNDTYTNIVLEYTHGKA